MPEGHTIHRLAARHQELFAGQPVVVDSPQGRFETGAQRITGSRLVDTEAYGKHLLLHFERDVSVHIHLGLYGKFADGVSPVPTPVGQVRLRMMNSAYWLELRGPTACELLDPAQVDSLRARLGPDPLRKDSDGDAAYQRIGRSDAALMGLLLDQSIVAGTGLIFVTEALFRAGISPTAPGRVLTKQAWRSIWDDLCALMVIAVESGRIDTVYLQHMPEAMGRPPRVDRHGGEVYVYRRPGQPCLVCGSAIQMGSLAGRNSYWCPACQS